jgi:L,D-transpeptidase ErfK/SrfK
MGRDRRSRGRARELTIRSVLALSLLFAPAAVAAAAPLLAPHAIADGIVINVPQRMLFLMQDGHVVARYPIAVGLRSWPTFLGTFTIVLKEVDPVWDVPPSIQEEMRRAGKTVLTHVAPGPDNPLGKFWLGLDRPNFGIHGTNAPGSVGKAVTHGCLRMIGADIEDLFGRIEVGTPGISVYEPILMGVIDGALWLEAHPDVYRLDRRDAARHVIAEAALLAPDVRLDPVAIRAVLDARDGRPYRVDLLSTP